MIESQAAVDDAITDLDRLRRYLKRSKTQQVQSKEERDVIKANCLAWFNSHSAKIRPIIGDEELQDVDDQYRQLLSASDRGTSRGMYDHMFRDLRSSLSKVRTQTVSPRRNPGPTTDEPPDFSSLVADPAMRGILERRWVECSTCILAGAPLASTVMMGGLLEALLLARVHRERDKSRVFRTSAAPKDPSSGKALPLQIWTLQHYIDVAHELGWISSSAHDVGEVVRDYRNYIHPYKELSHGMRLQPSDARLFWEISKGIARQLLDVAGSRPRPAVS